jgi:short-subunit dehydrogenase
MLARSQDRLSNLEGQLEGVKGYPCDVSDRAALERVLDSVKDELGSPSILVHNAVGGAFGSFLDIDPSVLENNFQVNTMALLHLARSLAPDMIATGEGAIIITGNTSAYRGMPGFAGFAPTKAAQRVLAESMARDLGPKGVHVGYVAIDAVIDLEWTRERMPDKPDDYFCKPQDIAEECYRIAHQPRSAWAFNSIIRPFGENWSVS